MRYDEVEKAIHEMVAAAEPEHRRRFGAATVVRLTGADELDTAAEVEFDEDAQQAFAEARRDPVNDFLDTPEMAAEFARISTLLHDDVR